MFTARVTVVGDDAIVEFEQMVVQTPTLARDFMARRIAPKLRQTVKRTLGKEPPRPRREIEWTSEKQRRAYFATDGFGAGIPYRRTHKLARGWHITVITGQGAPTITLDNAEDAVEWVYGPTYQQLFHQITGWPNLITVMPVLRKQASEIVLSEFWDFVTGGAVRSVR